MKDARKTVAVRAALTNFTPPSGGPASNPCLNCGTNVQLHFCPECGQAAIDPDPTLREFLHELAEQFLNWDGKLFATFRLLLTRPGVLTQEYLAGRRARYISPLRVYLLCSVLYFFVSTLVPKPPTVVQRGNTVSTRVGPVVVNQTGGASTRDFARKLSVSPNRFKRAWGQHFGAAMDRRTEMESAIATTVPRTMFALVPIFAVLAALIFRYRRMRYPQHLAFALHFHAFAFLAMIPMRLVRDYENPAIQVGVMLAALACVAAYLATATRRAYGTTLRGAIVRDALLLTAYFPVFLVSLLATFVVVVLLKF